MTRRLAIAFILAAGLLLWGAWQLGGSGSAQGPLHIESRVSYIIQPDVVDVSWRVDLQNNDPSTAGVAFYESLTLPILGGASAVGATGPTGGTLFVSLDDSPSDSLSAATVSFDEPVFFGETYSFTLSYRLAATRSDLLLVTPAYIYLPAISAGDASSVTVTAPSDAGWDVTVDAADCEGGPVELVCGASGSVLVAAFVEVTRPDALQSATSTAELASGPLDVTIRYFPGEEDWAGHIEEVARAALPILEELSGFPYDGPRALTISERGRQDIAGYEGTFACSPAACEIGISPVADDLTAVHELAHLWTRPFSKRWLAEGLAEFTSQRTAGRLGALVSGEPRSEPLAPADFPLDEWERPRFLIGAEEGDLAREETGYWESLAFFERLERTVGLAAIQRANLAASERARDVDTQVYFDLLEEASAARLDELFLEEVFPASYVETLEQRRVVRAQLEETEARVEALGLSLPRGAENLVDQWRFNEAADILSNATATMDVYEEAQEAVDGSRSLWERIGLIGSDAGADLEDARAAFASGDFAGARRHAEEASDLIDGAGRSALIRMLIAAGALAALLLAVAGAAWFVRRRQEA